MAEPQTYEEFMARARAMAGEVDVALAACRPVTPTSQERELAVMVGMNLDVPYDGSQRGACKLCDREVWIGPRTQDLLVEQPEKVMITCLMCAAAYQMLVGAPDTPVVNLGSVHPTDG